MSEPDLDVLVVGGGIHGVGVAQAAAAAGYRCLLLEKDDLAHGTSGRSSKLIHGGLRYLETAQFGLVRESLAEREVLLRIGPDLVRLVPFHVPVYETSRRPPWQIRAGLCAYALLGNLGKNGWFETVPASRWNDLDGLRRDGLRAVFRYRDAQTDDSRLTRAVAASATELGASLALGSRFVAARRTDAGYEVTYESPRGRSVVRTRTIVNAAGPWVHRVLDAVSPPPRRLDVDLVQGTHVVVRGRLERGVYYAEAPRDGRAVFVMPWGERTLVGTTETPFEGDPDQVRPLDSERDYLAETFDHYFPSRSWEPVEAYAGLRVLPKGPGPAFRRPRELVLLGDLPRPSRIVTVYGGKLTAYRSSAAKVLKRLAGALPPRRPLADTASLPLRPPIEGS